MKSTVLSLMIAVFLVLSGCQSAEDHPSFEGTVIRVDEVSIIVEPFEDEDIRRSGSEVSISDEDLPDYQVGDTVKVTHEGPVMESHPLQIDLIEIERVE